MPLTEWGRGVAIEKGIYCKGQSKIHVGRIHVKERKIQFLNRFSDLFLPAQIFLLQWLSHFESIKTLTLCLTKICISLQKFLQHSWNFNTVLSILGNF
jgi:hypothetical protein